VRRVDVFLCLLCFLRVLGYFFATSHLSLSGYHGSYWSSSVLALSMLSFSVVAAVACFFPHTGLNLLLGWWGCPLTVGLSLPCCYCFFFVFFGDRLVLPFSPGLLSSVVVLAKMFVCYIAKLIFLTPSVHSYFSPFFCFFFFELSRPLLAKYAFFYTGFSRFGLVSRSAFKWPPTSTPSHP